MTITYADGFAIFPKRCAYCNRLFIFEHYWKRDIRLIDTGPIDGIHEIYRIECKHCHKKKDQEIDDKLYYDTVRKVREMYNNLREDKND